jgi:GT2 family glycosyltransferase
LSTVCDVVIPTRNRPDRLALCLSGLRQQSFRDFRVVIVDDASEIPAQEQVTEEDLDGLDVAFIRLTQPSGPGAARNAGAAHGSARYIVFLDDDVRPDWRLVQTHLSAVTADLEDRVVSCGPFLAPYDWDPTPWNSWEARQALKEATALATGVYAPTWRQFHTGNNCLPRGAFDEVGGFDASFTRAEDDELALRLHRLGCRFQFEAQAIAWHYSERSLESWLSIPQAYAHFEVRIDELYPEAGFLARKVFELDQRHVLLRLLRRTARGPAHALAVRSAVLAGRALWASGLAEASMLAFSAAWDLAYAASLQRELRLRRMPAPQLNGSSPGNHVR